MNRGQGESEGGGRERGRTQRGCESADPRDTAEGRSPLFWDQSELVDSMVSPTPVMGPKVLEPEMKGGGPKLLKPQEYSKEGKGEGRARERGTGISYGKGGGRPLGAV